MTFYQMLVDFNCYETTNFKISGDTFLLEKTTALQELGIFSYKYLKAGTKLIPLTDDNQIDIAEKARIFEVQPDTQQ